MQSKKPETCNEFPHKDPVALCAVLTLEGKNLSYVLLKIYNQIKQKTYSDAGSCFYVLLVSSNKDVNLINPKCLTLEKRSFSSLRMAFGQRAPIDKQAKMSFQVGLH